MIIANATLTQIELPDDSGTSGDAAFAAPVVVNIRAQLASPIRQQEAKIEQMSLDASGIIYIDLYLLSSYPILIGSRLTVLLDGDAAAQVFLCRHETRGIKSGGISYSECFVRAA